MTKASPTRLAAREARKAGSDPVVTRAGVTEDVPLGARSYVLAAPTQAEIGGVIEAEALAERPDAWALDDAVRAVLANDEASLAALDAYDAAETEWIAFSNVHIFRGPDATESIQAQAVELQRALIVARRGRNRAHSRASRDAEVRRVQAAQQTAGMADDCRLVAALLRGWAGPGLPEFPEDLDAAVVEGTVPYGDLAALAIKARALMAPTADAGKDSPPPSP